MSVCLSACLSVCLYVPSYLRQFRMRKAGIAQACPGDGMYIKYVSKFPGGGDITIDV